MKTAQGKGRFEKLRLMAPNSLKRSMDLIESLLDSVICEREKVCPPFRGN